MVVSKGSRQPTVLPVITPMNYDNAMTKMEQYPSESSIGMRLLAFTNSSLTELETCSVREKIVLVRETCPVN